MSIDINLKDLSARFVTFEIVDGGYYSTMHTYKLYLNDCFVKDTDKCANTLFDLKPDKDYILSVKDTEEKELASIAFKTMHEFVTLDVRSFGAKGDGINDDTKFIQAAILSCPKDSRVLIPKGKYLISSIFLKSDLRLEISKEAHLIAINDREEFVKFPALIESYDESDEYILGTWEGNPLPSFASVITGINVTNVSIYGEGTIDGNASKENWWDRPKVMRGAYRPRLFFINHSSDVSLVGVTLKNSPAWTIHPFFSNDLKFHNIYINNPSDSPNTDGLDPESCKNVDIFGVHFSLGDDCIAVKSGKIYMGRKYKTPSENISITRCLMEDGHGAVTIGSEMAGGVINLTVEHCEFNNTDRGLRIKTRRGRGKDAIIDGITFKNIKMNHVMTPFVINAFYFCDPDGKIEYVQSREMMPCDDRTPRLKNFLFENIDAHNCYVCAVWIEGLPECKVESVTMKNINVDFALDTKSDVPAMSCGVEKCSRKGIIVKNIDRLQLDNVNVTGQDGEVLVKENVNAVI